MIIYSSSGTGSATIDLPQYGDKLNIINDDATQLTVTVGAIPVVVRGLEQFNGDFVPFNTVVVAASGPWRFVVELVGEGIGADSGTTRIPELLERVRQYISDKEAAAFENVELVGYLNDAIGWLSSQLIAVKDPEMIKEIAVDETGIPVPGDFQKACGVFPVEVTGSRLRVMKGIGTVSFQYFAIKSPIRYIAESNYFEPMYSPFKEVYDTILIQKTAILALNQNEFDVSQDERLLAQSLASVGVSANA